MNDIETRLKNMKAQPAALNEALRRQTREMCADAVRPRANSVRTPVRRSRPKLRWGMAAAALAVAAALVFALLPIGVPTAQAAAFYTVDINPSISFEVTDNDTVISARAQNDDAAALLVSLRLEGESFSDALRIWISACVQAGYLDDSGNVLVARFGSGGLSQPEVQAIVSAQAGSTVRAMLMTAQKEEFQFTYGGESSGMLLLRRQAGQLGIEDKPAGELFEQMYTHEYGAGENAQQPPIAGQTPQPGGEMGSDTDTPGSTTGDNPGGGTAPGSSETPGEPGGPRDDDTPAGHGPGATGGE